MVAGEKSKEVSSQGLKSKSECAKSRPEGTVSSDVSSPLPKKSSPMSKERDVSLSSRGGNPHVLTYTTIPREIID